MKVPEIDQLNTAAKRGALYIKKNFPEFYDSLPKVNKRFPEILYIYYHGTPPKCPVCGKDASFISFSKGYLKYCSTACANSDPEKKAKVEHTCTERYGTKTALQNKEIQKKIKCTLLEKYGKNFQEQQKQKRIATNRIKYGCDYGLSSPEVRTKIKNTCMERYGVPNVLLVPEFAVAMKDAVIKKYGSDNVFKSPEICEKIWATNIERYGVKYPFQSTEIQRKCAHRDTTIEQFIIQILDEHHIKYAREDCTVIPPARVDFSLPDYNIAIECNGTYWHSDKLKPANHHKNRFIHCTAAGWQLLTVWEDQIYRIPQIVESVLLSKLHIYKRRLGARQCAIKEIDSSTCNKFLDMNHIQGRTSSKIKLGAYIKDELVGVMTFIQSRGCQGSKVKIDGQWELNRFCTLLGTQVVGLTSKMLKYFIKQYQPTSIISFSHNDISVGDVYSKLGFKKVGKISTSYYYIKSNHRYHRSNFTRSRISRCWPEYDINDKSWTERQVMDEKNYYRIFDCGTQKWVLNAKDLL